MRLSAARRIDHGELTAGDFAVLMEPFGPFETRPEIAVAVSGGRDSLALALLAAEWATGREGRILALIVDHGLRSESLAEARATRELLMRSGIEAEILSWIGTKPERGVQEAARQARYGLLLKACRRHGILHLLLGHHADDQDETIVMRASRDSGPDGLAGMAALAEHRAVRVLRPLLEVRRACLTATLQSRGIAWIDDPSNSDPRFERSRLRKNRIKCIVPWHDRARWRGERESALARAAVEIVEIDDAGRIAVDRLDFAELGDDQRMALLSRLVQAVGGADYPPRRLRLSRATARVSQATDRGKSGKSQDFTLSGCRLMLRQAPRGRRMRWIVGPESGRNSARKGVQPLIPARFFACSEALAPHLDV